MTRNRSALPAAAILALTLAPFAGAALAQNSATGLVEVEDDATMVDRFGITADELEELDVFDASGARIGEVEDVLADASGGITAVAVEFDGFAGMGDRELVVGLDSLTLKGNRLVTGITEAAALPRWD